MTTWHYLSPDETEKVVVTGYYVDWQEFIIGAAIIFVGISFLMVFKNSWLVNGIEAFLLWLGYLVWIRSWKENLDITLYTDFEKFPYKSNRVWVSCWGSLLFPIIATALTFFLVSVL